MTGEDLYDFSIDDDEELLDQDSAGNNNHKDSGNNLMPNEVYLPEKLQKIKVSKKLKLVYFGLKTGWSIQQVEFLVGKKWLSKNLFSISVLDKYFGYDR